MGRSTISSDSHCSICEEIRRRKNNLDREARRHSLKHEDSYERNHLGLSHHHHHAHEDFLDHKHHHHTHEELLDLDHHHHHGTHHRHHEHERWTILPWPVGGQGGGAGAMAGAAGSGGNEHEHKERIEIILKQPPAPAAPPANNTVVVKKDSEQEKRLKESEKRSVEDRRTILKQQEIIRSMSQEVAVMGAVARQGDRNENPDNGARRVSRGTGEEFGKLGNQRSSPRVGSTNVMVTVPVTSGMAGNERKDVYGGGMMDDPEDRRSPEPAVKKRSKVRPADPEPDDEAYAVVREPDPICWNCRTGRFVKKFTWSGIIAAIICFPCGIYICFQLRETVCSYCGIMENENRVENK